MSDFVETLIPHIKNLVTFSSSKYINTGDRMMDTILIAIFGVIISVFVTNITYIFKLVYDYFQINIFKNDKFDPVRVNPKEYDISIISKYKFNYFVDIRCEEGSNKNYGDLCTDEVEVWILRNYGSFISESSCEMVFNGVRLYHEGKESKITNIRMPIYRYIKNNRYEYIVYYDRKIYCDDLQEFTLFIKQFFVTDKIVDDVGVKYIYELDSKGALIKKGRVNNKKVFARIHIDGKEKIIMLLNKFKNGTLYPDELSLDNKIGFLFHGPPGTGKSGLCTAIANYLNRDILLLNSLITAPRAVILSVIEKCRKTHVIVLDEFDYILGRTDETVIDYNKLLSEATTKEEIAKIKNDAIQAKKAEMSDEEFILKLFDSFGDDTDRVIVANTNSLKNINVKYLRPGRIDDVSLIGYCSIGMFEKICHSKYENINDLILKHKDEIMKCLELNITPLVLINTLIKTDSFDELIEKLSNERKQEYTGDIKII